MEKLGKPISLEEHLDLIYRKTACLFSVCMRVGGILGGATAQQEEHLGQYGRDLGMAFQIVDDVLDLTASESVLGKPVASDLREGKATMSVIHALEHCTAAERHQIETILRDRAFNGVTHADILAILKRYGSLEYASQRGRPVRRIGAERYLHVSRLGDQTGAAVGAGVRGGERKIAQGCSRWEPTPKAQPSFARLGR